MKKSLIFWFAAVTCAAWILVGCESPTNGDAGAAGTDGKNVGFINAANVGAAVLDALFLEGDIVTLGPDVTTVEGVVPAGKKLAVSGETAVGDISIDGTETLEIKAGGSVEVHKGAALFATFDGTVAGGVIGAAGSVYGDGAVMLPYVTDSTWPNPDGYLTYNNSTAPNKAAGSVTDGPTQPVAVTEAGVGALLATASELTVYNLTGITDTTIPAGKKLYLMGSGNTISTANFNLTAAGAELIVQEGAVLDASAYKIEGNVTNNGTIESTATVAANQKALLTLNGAGTVKLGAEGAGAVDNATLALTQNVEIADSGTLKAPVVATPFSGGKTITISGTGVLDFGAAVAGLSLSGVTIVNKGTAAGAITTATASDAALATIMGAGGKITASADITALTQALTVPADVELTANSATLTTGAFAVTVDGEASLTSATLAQATSLAVDGDLTIAGGAAAKVAAATGTGNITLGTAASLTTATTFTFPGVITFGDTFTTSAASPGIVFEGTVAFEGNLTLTAAPVTFEGAAFFANGVVVTLSNTSSAIKLSGKTGALAVGTPVANVPDIYSTVLIGNDAGTGGTLAAGTANGATLTFATTGITQDAPAANDHGITITGKVAAIPLKSYTVASASSKVGTLTVDTGAVLTLDAGTLAPYNSYATGLESDWTAKLVLTGAATANGALLKGAGSVVAGGTTIVGGTNGWQAATGSANVTIAKDAINVASGGTLTAQDADAAITVTASRLAVTGEIVLASGKGKLILKGDDTTAGSLLLKGHASNAGKLRVAVDSSTVKVGATVTNSTFLIFAASGMSATTQAYVTAADGTKVTPANLSVNGGNTDASSGTTLSSINAGNEADTKDVLITGQTAEANALTIISGAYVKVTNSDA